MSEKRWTDLTIQAIKPREDQYELKAPGFPGLRLLVYPNGRKVFILRYTFGTRVKAGRVASHDRKLTFNDYIKDTGALAAAVKRYQEAQTELHNGHDPADLFKRKRAGNPENDDTVTAYIKVFEDQHVKVALTPGSQANVLRELKRIGEAVGAKDVAKLTQEDVQKIIDKSINRKGRANGLAARNQTYKVAKQFFAWAAKRAGVTNPAEEIEKPAPDGIGERTLDDDEIKIVWKAATKAGPIYGGYVKLLLLTACRRDEIAYLMRREVTAAAIELPGGKVQFPDGAMRKRTKNGDAHTVPLTWLMRKMLAGFPKGGEFVVTGNGHGLGGHTQALAEVEDYTDIPHWTFQDLRRTAMTNFAKLGIKLEVAERMLNHRRGTGRSPLQRIYNKHQYAAEIREGFALWTDHVAALVGEKQDRAAA